MIKQYINCLYIYSILILLYCNFYVFCQLPNIKQDRFINHRLINREKEINLNNSKYDYIIIGSGSAGSVLSKRLSVNNTVLTLEAGKIDNITEIAIPVLSSQLFKSEYDWNYESETEETLNGRSIYIPRGKLIGGSSSINTLVVNRGSEKIYNIWDNIFDLKGWSWNDILKYYKKSQNYLSNDIDLKYQSNKGEWKQRQPPYRFNITKTIVKRLKKLGLFDYDKSHQDGNDFGFNTNVVNIDEMGMRHSLADAFLDKNVLNNKNLYVRPYSHVTKILFNKKSKRYCFLKNCNNNNNKHANSVEFIDLLTNKKYIVHANKEIILSAGAINTPQILLLSGVGNKKTLKKYNIPLVKHNRYVGKNLQDHPIVGMTYNITSSNFTTLENSLTFDNLLTYFSTGTGPFSSNINEGLSYQRSKYSKRYLGNLPDYRYVFAPAYYIKYGFVTFPPPNKGFTVGVELLNSKSKGYVSIKSNNPFDKPKIKTNFFKVKRDLDIVIDGFNKLRHIFHNDPYFKQLIDNEVVPGSNVINNQQLIDYIKEYVITGYHSCCTCRMTDSNNGVVDDRLRVIGINNLRIVDASVFRFIPNHNINSITVATAEKASDMILEDNE